jgi:hypothetical protein
MTETPRKVRIIAVPPGEAPLWVREKWVGLELPLAQKSHAALSRPTDGVLSGPKSALAGLVGFLLGRYSRTSGFVVPVLGALQVLEVASPEAANWWRTNTPHLCKPSRRFMFRSHVCEVVG